MTNAEDAARVRASGLDNLMWCVGAASPSSVRSFIPQLCDQHPEVGRDVLRRVADVLEVGVTRVTRGITVVHSHAALHLLLTQKAFDRDMNKRVCVFFCKNTYRW